MNNESMQEKIQRFLKNPFVIIGIIMQIVFIILIVFLIQNITKKETVAPEIKIQNNNFNEVLKELPSEVPSYFERNLYNIVSQNTSNTFNISDSGAEVRKESIVKKYFKELNLNYLYFIVDIPSIQQSYQFRYEWSEDKNNKYVSTNESLMSMCLPKDKMIYPDFDCQDKYNKNGPSLAIYGLIKNLNWKVNGQIFIVTPQGKTDDLNFYYRVEVNSCGDKNLENQTKQVFEKQITDLGFEVSEIPYQLDGFCNR